jgi:hypothetical protein
VRDSERYLEKIETEGRSINAGARVCRVGWVRQCERMEKSIQEREVGEWRWEGVLHGVSQPMREGGREEM